MFDQLIIVQSLSMFAAGIDRLWPPVMLKQNYYIAQILFSLGYSTEIFQYVCYTKPKLKLQ